MKIQIIIMSLLLAACCRPKDGRDGLSGVSGRDGRDGSNGHNALVVTENILETNEIIGQLLRFGTDLNDNGILEASETSQTATIMNGKDGQNGINGVNGINGADAPPTAFTPISILNPCGNNPAIVNEIFLKLSNGTIIASFSQNASGLNTRWAVLTVGTYQTTDGDACTFTLNANGEFTYQSKMY